MFRRQEFQSRRGRDGAQEDEQRSQRADVRAVLRCMFHATVSIILAGHRCGRAPMNTPLPTDLGDTERTMGVAYSVIGAVMLGAGGYALDRWLDTGPWLALLGLVLGAVIAVIGLRTLIRDRAGS